MNVNVSACRILRRDWPSTGFLIFTSLCLSLCLGVTIYSGLWQDADALRFATFFLGLIATPITLIWGGIIVWRVNLIRRLLFYGPYVQGRVLELGMNSEDISHAIVGYRFADQDYRTIITTESVRAGFSPQPGEDVQLVIDPRRPSRAFFVAMFTAGD